MLPGGILLSELFENAGVRVRSTNELEALRDRPKHSRPELVRPIPYNKAWMGPGWIAVPLDRAKFIRQLGIPTMDPPKREPPKAGGALPFAPRWASYFARLQWFTFDEKLKMAVVLREDEELQAAIEATGHMGGNTRVLELLAARFGLQTP